MAIGYFGDLTNQGLVERWKYLMDSIKREKDLKEMVIGYFGDFTNQGFVVS